MTQPPTLADELAPRLHDGVSMLPFPGGLLVDDGSRSTLLGAVDHGPVVPNKEQLELAFDGEHTWTAAACVLALGMDETRAVGSELARLGLLDRTPWGTVTPVAEHVRNYYARLLGPRYDTGAQLHLQRLQSASVDVVGTLGPTGAQMVTDLTSAGFGRAALLDDGADLGLSVRDDGPGNGGTASRILIVQIDLKNRAGSREFLDTAQHARLLGLPVITWSASESGINIGPALTGENSLCLTCASSDHAEANDTAPNDVGNLPAVTAFQHLGAALVVQFAIDLVGANLALPSIDGLTRYGPAAVGTERFHCVSDPNCPTCVGPGPQTPSWATTTASLCERDFTGYPRTWSRVPTETEPHAAIVRRWSQDRSTYPHRPSKDLAAMPLAPAPNTPIDHDPRRLGRLLRYCVGERDSNAGGGRWVPSAGEFGSVATYLLTAADPFGLPGDVFRYLDTTHRIESVQRWTRRQGTAGLTQMTPGSVTLVLTSDVRRLHRKYGEFAYRLGHLDTGCVVSQLDNACSLLDLQLIMRHSWPVTTADDIGADAREEVVTAVVVIRDLNRRSC